MIRADPGDEERTEFVRIGANLQQLRNVVNRPCRDLMSPELRVELHVVLGESRHDEQRNIRVKRGTVLRSFGDVYSRNARALPRLAFEHRAVSEWSERCIKDAVRSFVSPEMRCDEAERRKCLADCNLEARRVLAGTRRSQLRHERLRSRR